MNLVTCQVQEPDRLDYQLTHSTYKLLLMLTGCRMAAIALRNEGYKRTAGTNAD